MSSLAEESTGPGPAANAAPGAAARPRRLGAILQGVALVLGLALLGGGFGWLAVDYRPYAVPTGSMQPTIAAGDTVLARQVSGSSVGRGDVVVFQDPAWGNATLVKRVIGIGGDTVVCCDDRGRITVDGKAIDEPYLAPSTVPPSPFTAQVPAGRLFLMGDNRVASLDSRVHLDQFNGTVPTTAVKARVEATVWPLGHTGLRGRTVAFDDLAGRAAAQTGPLVPAAWAAVAGAAVIVLTSLTGPVAAQTRRLRGRR